MTLANLALAVFLVFYALATLGWIAVSATVLGVTALIAGVLLLLEGTGTYTYKVRQ